MGKYRIKHWGQQQVELYGGEQYWRELSQEQAADLDLDEIHELNKLSNASQQRADQQRSLPLAFRLIVTAMLLLFFVSLLALDALPYLRMPDLSFLNRSAELYKDEALISLKTAVVSIEGSRSSGSGFNLRPDGLIVSNRHVVEDNIGVMVIFPDGSRYVARNWLFIEEYDLAVCDIKGENLPHVELSSALPAEGEELIFIGNPLGFDWTISEASMLAQVDTDDGTVLYFSGPVRSGSSGSPLFNQQGQVTGVIFASLRDVPDVGLAIPAQLLLSYVQQE